MKHLPVIIWPLVYAFIFGAVVTQGVFYLYEREATGFLYVLFVAILRLLAGHLRLHTFDDTFDRRGRGNPAVSHRDA